jgi:excinuclease ABC subunit A
VLVIEHNLDVIKTADYIVDLGPEGGNRGGLIVAAGAPEDVVKVPESYTGKYLKPILERDTARTVQAQGTDSAESKAAASKKNSKQKENAVV